MDEILTTINTVGFPIAACVYLAVVQRKTVEKMTEIVNNNTKALDKLMLLVTMGDVEDDEE